MGNVWADGRRTARIQHQRDMMRGNSRTAAKRRPSKKTAFLSALTETVNVTLACRGAGIPRRSAYDWRENDEDFARRWDEALDEGIDLLEAELQRRAFEGTERPVFYKGQQCGTWRTYSDALAMFLLKAHRPKKYRDSLANQLKDDTPEEEDALTRLMKEITAGAGDCRTGRSQSSPAVPPLFGIARPAALLTALPPTHLTVLRRTGRRTNRKTRRRRGPPALLTQLRRTGGKARKRFRMILPENPPSTTNRRAAVAGRWSEPRWRLRPGRAPGFPSPPERLT